MTVGIYIRVSTVEQATEGYSIAAQKERLLSYCKAQGWDNYKFYIDEGISAKDMNRLELKKLFKDMRNGQITMILVYRLDRFTRRVVDFHRMLEEMNKYNCTFKSATEAYDTSSAMGRMFISLVATIAQWETENMSERIKMALEEKVSKGERSGGVPFGFDLSEEETLVKNGKETIILDMIEKTFDGWSLNKLSDYVYQIDNSRFWSSTGIKRILQNPALYGSTRWKNVIYDDTHEGIISKDKFDKLQQVLKDRSRHNRRDVKSTYLFQSVLACPNCGHTTTPNRVMRKRKDGTERQFVLYRCNQCRDKKQSNKAYNEEVILKGLYDYMENVELPKVEEVPKQNEKNIYIEQLAKVERKREKYQRAWAADHMTDKEFHKLMNETREIHEELKEKTKDIKKPTPIDIESIKNTITTFNENFKVLTKEEKRIFIIRFIRKIEFESIDQPAKNPKLSKTGRSIIVIKKVVFA